MTIVKKKLREQAWREYLAGRTDFAPRLRRSPAEWATAVRRIAGGTATISNLELPYDHRVMPHCIEPMNAADDPRIKTIVLWFARREGKTLGVCLNLVGWKVTDNPCNIYSVHPIEDDVQRFSEGDLEPTIEACLESYFVDRKSRDSGRTIFFKKYKGGWIRIVNSGALTKFRGTTVGLLLLHELDKLALESIALAEGRTTGIPDAKIVKESTGTLESNFTPEGKEEYRSNIKQAYDQGTKEKWFCACKECGFLQTIVYEQIRHPKNKPELARYHCSACDYPHTPAEWRRMAAGGKWYPTARLTDEEIKDIEHTYRRAVPVDPSVRSFWRNGFTSLLPHHTAYRSKLHEFVAEGEAAKTSTTTLKVWTQEVRAELWSETQEGEAPPSWKKIYARRENYGLTLPMGALMLFAFADVQQNRVEVFWGAYGKREEFWGMDHVVIDGSYLAPLTWDKLRAELKRKWKHESGAELSLEMSHVDCGKWGDEIGLLFFRTIRERDAQLHGHVRASKGIGRNGYPIVMTGNKAGMMAICGRLKGSHIGTWAAKDVIYARLRMELPTAEQIAEGAAPIPDGWMHFNEQFDERVCEQFASERVSITHPLGEEIRAYKNPDLSRNEGLDGLVGLLAGVRMRPRNWDALRAHIEESAKPEKERKKPQAGFMSDLGGMRF